MKQDPSNPKQSLSEIGHLFLSSLRERQTGGAPRPIRKPPAPREISIDLTPEEFAEVFANGTSTPEKNSSPTAPFTAIIGANLSGAGFDRAREYAAHLAGDGLRIGLIECDASLFRVMLIQRNEEGVAAEHEEPVAAEGLDGRRMRETLEELCSDVDRWLLVLPSPRAVEARTLLGQVEQWVLLSTCDHDGVVSCYRTLKGLADLKAPRLSLALLDASDEHEADRVFQKLASVTQQFLSWPLEAEPLVRQRTEDITEHLVLSCRATRDKAPAGAPQWELLSEFVARSKSAPRAQRKISMPHLRNTHGTPPMEKQFVADVVIPESGEPMPEMHVVHEHSDDASDVLELPEGASTPTAIISAVLRGGTNQLVECPIKPPMCPDASLAIGRNHQLTLVAVARQGLSDLRSIGRGYQWLMENRSLVAMALPQFAIDAHKLPRLELLIDQADLSADLLQPMLQSGNVSVTAYRKLRWAGRTGLLLNAA